MQRFVSVLIVMALAAAQQASAKPAAPAQNELQLRVGETLAVKINDQPVRIRLEPDAISVPTLNADVAQRLGLKPSMIGYIYVIGPERIRFSTDNVPYRAGDAAFKRRTAFSNRQLVEGADGVAGPATFPFRRTVLTLRDPQPGDRAVTFPLDEEMGRTQTGTTIDVGGRPIYVAFSFARAESLVTATGGKWIADANGGQFNGEAREAPVLYGVSRSIRSLKLDRPLMLGELEVRNLAVRVSDMGNARGIAEAAPPEQDPNEIVVTAVGKGKVPSQRLYAGLDTIGHCASITYDFDAKTITLMCPAQP